MKDQIVSLSYTVKTIGVQGEEVGIASKRLPLKLKKKEEYSGPPATMTANNYLPHQCFYSQSLVPIKKEKEKPNPEDESSLRVISSKNPIRIDEDGSY